MKLHGVEIEYDAGTVTFNGVNRLNKESLQTVIKNMKKSVIEYPNGIFGPERYSGGLAAMPSPSLTGPQWLEVLELALEKFPKGE